MDMPVTMDAKTDDGWELSATAADRKIDIELERLTERTTRMRGRREQRSDLLQGHLDGNKRLSYK
jgi:hypothetical protein